ncbi:helix-turn-helix transcriptional regulator [Aureibacillus halotolerans]|uniref:Putative DNA-binding transcriptional regulator YafY n=1 Tax=Aureibacillus halotolerans TaxID=1508390 RepID=A0A4R6U409_9BACI|nr:YafY family protein [Aureibacillus halotolerans]TDQ40811.1 putative DNA-binding transcriptional regulator YafY [Aureibacillus halotolerans]
MRGDRLLMIVLLLQTRKQMTAKELANELDVSERTIYRDMEALSLSGIPVIAERGQQGGWSLLGNYQTSLTGLKEDEIRALFISPSNAMLADLGMGSFSKEAREKLLASLPSQQLGFAQDVRDRIHIDTSTWHKENDYAHTLETLQTAIWSEHLLEINYQKADGTTSERMIGPLGLVLKGSSWYVVALSGGNIRTFRISRIGRISNRHEGFERPEDFSLSSYWTSSSKAFTKALPVYDVMLKVRVEVLPRLTFSDRFARIRSIGEVCHGWANVSITFADKKEALGYVLGYGNQMKIVTPASLQQALLDSAQGIVDLYQ